MTFEKYLAVLWKHARVILACALVAGLATLAVTTLLTPTYEAEADVALIKSSVDLNFEPKFKTGSELNATQTLIDQSARRKALVTIANSPDLASAVRTKLGAQLNESERAPAKLVRAINARSDGDLIRITAKADTAEKAALLANIWAQEYTNRVNDIYGESPLTSSEIQVQADAAKRTYGEKESALVGYLSDNPSSQLQRALQQKQQTLSDSLAVSNKLERLLADAHSLRDRLTSSETNTNWGAELAKLLLEANSFSTATNLPVSAQPTDANSSSPINLQLQLDQLKLDTTPAQQLSDLDSLIAALEARQTLVQSNDVKQLQQDVNQLQAMLEQESSRRQELTRARDLAWNTYTTISNKVAEVSVAEQAKGSVVRLAVAAVMPQEPVEPRKVLYTTLASIAGLVLGIALAFLLEYADVNSTWRAASRAQRESELALSQPARH